MQIFEFHFNPDSKSKEKRVFDTFIYEPESAYEKKLGSLYITGEIKNNLPSNLRLLDNIAQIFKKNYYGLLLKSPEKSLSNASKKVNEFLAEEVKKENVDWLGNLNFGIISLNNFNLAFTKTGDLKIILLRNGQIIDIGKNLELQDIDPYPLKIFFNVVSGQLAENDIIIMLTREVSEFFQQENILAKFSQAEKIDAQIMKNIIPPPLFKKGAGAKVSGACLIIALTPSSEKKAKPILFKSTAKQSLLNVLSSLAQKIPKPRIPKFKTKFKVPVKSANQILENFKSRTGEKKKILLIGGLIILLFIGFLLFKGFPEKKSGESGVSLEAKEDFSRWSKLEQLENPELIKDLAGKPEIEITKEVSFLAGADLFFSQPDKLYFLNKNIWEEKTMDFAGFHPDIFCSYLSNLYFLDKANCEIIKYSHLAGIVWDEGKKWLPSQQNCQNPKSMAIDGSVWILNSDNSISVYYSGAKKKEINIEISPTIENATIIKTKINVPYLYLLEPINNRIIITDKEGKIVKQFQSDKFNNLKYFDISPAGKTIYLLNDSKVYKIEAIKN